MDMSISPLGLHPRSRWHRLVHLCEKSEEEDGKMLTISIGGNNKWGEWICPVGTVSIGDQTPCVPCQNIEYTCHTSGATVFRKTVCPLGAKYPDRRLDLLGHNLPATCSEEDEITEPRKSCPQMQRDTIAFVSALWKKDCDIKTNGNLRDLLNEAGPHCGTVHYSCPAAEGWPQPKEWQYCAKKIGTWELSMRQFLMGLSLSCTVEGSGKTALWWKYYQGIINKVPPKDVYTPGLPDGVQSIFAEHLVWEYRWQRGPWSIVRYPEGEYAYVRPAFFRNHLFLPPMTSWPWPTMGKALHAVCSPSDIEGSSVENTSNSSEGKEGWAEIAIIDAEKNLLCPAPELR